MILTGKEIERQIAEGKIGISDFDQGRLGPNSYNLRLSDELKVYDQAILDTKIQNRSRDIKIPAEGLVLWPGELYIGSTMEYTWTDSFIPMLEGRSSAGRIGLSVHSTAGFGDIGFRGCWTLEISVIKPVRVYPGTQICQIYYLTPCGDAGILYNGKYQGQIRPVTSRLYLDKEGE